MGEILADPAVSPLQKDMFLGSPQGQKPKNLGSTKEKARGQKGTRTPSRRTPLASSKTSLGPKTSNSP